MEASVASARHRRDPCPAHRSRHARTQLGHLSSRGDSKGAVQDRTHGHHRRRRNVRLDVQRRGAGKHEDSGADAEHVMTYVAASSHQAQ